VTDIVVDSKLLCSELGFVAELSCTNRPGSLLQFALCEAQNGFMRLMTAASDAVAWSAVPLISASHAPVTFVVPASRLYSILSGAGVGETLTISIAGESVGVDWPGTRIRIKNNTEAQAKLEENVLIEQFQGPDYKVTASDLKRALAGALPFIWRRRTTPVDLNAIFFIPKDGLLQIAAFNSSAAFATKITPALGQPFATSIAIPSADVRSIIELTPVPTDLVTVTQGNGLVRFDCAPRGLTVTPVASKTPHFDYFLDVSDSLAQVRVEVEVLRNSIRPMLIGSQKYIKLNFAVSDNSRLALYAEYLLGDCHV